MSNDPIKLMASRLDWLLAVDRGNAMISQFEVRTIQSRINIAKANEYMRFKESGGLKPSGLYNLIADAEQTAANLIDMLLEIEQELQARQKRAANND